ncbi:TlpA family protein disulfide reductase [Salegentibacter sp. JZCK2]|uniref:peroxiredoxin family protein n=1 Tax=Salegentibacter tibetensis TaxID=2873600 RepID=UPI001CCE6319|nr:TlpA disulfide reductase family protein [Salegentibacter tibetensis]MBZ9731521.1 TlpA family protein disulfide reductase [Salegentibacter tibetensis]
MFKIIKISTLSLMALFLFSACNFGNSKSSEENKEKEEIVKQVKEENTDSKRKAPQFEVTTIDGQKISLEQSLSDNKPMMIYFTASWCPMCAKNWPAISEVYPEYKDRINFVAISIDPTDDKDVMTKLAEEKNLDFPLVTGTPQVMINFGVDSQATTVGISDEGYIEFQKDKTVLSAEEYRDLFEQLLN